jgi:lipopolysaccharide export system protein LptA
VQESQSAKIREDLMTLRRTAFIFLTLTGVSIFVWATRNVLTYDPVALFRGAEQHQEINPISIKINDVKFAHYEGARLVSTANIDLVAITKQKNLLYFNKINSGHYYNDKNESLNFEAEKGEWNASSKVLQAKEKIRVHNNDFDLSSDQFQYEESYDRLYIPHAIAGKLRHGDLEASTLLYNTKDESFTLGPLTWTGYLEDLDTTAIDKQKKKDTSRKKWTIKAEGVSRPPGDIETWKKGQATDGEIVIIGDKLERNVKSDVLVAIGNVRYYSEEVNMICDKATVYRKEKKAILEHHIQAVVKPKDQAKLEVVEIEPIRPVVPSDIAKIRPAAPKANEKEKELDRELQSAESKRKYPTLVWADKIIYWYEKGKRRAEITGNPQAKQDLPGQRWRHIWTNKAYYDGEKDTLKMLSSPGKKDTIMRTSLGDDLHATSFEVSTKEEVEEWSGEGIEGDVYVEPEEDDEKVN